MRILTALIENQAFGADFATKNVFGFRGSLISTTARRRTTSAFIIYCGVISVNSTRMQQNSSSLASSDFEYAKLPSWWIPDDKVDKCGACYTGFGFFLRKVRGVFIIFQIFKKLSRYQVSTLPTYFTIASLSKMWTNILLEMHDSKANFTEC